jgi:DNA-binding LacI/PurR family transcriptional regulator
VNINIKKIAKQAAVSTATVSRALNNNGSVKEETRLRILQIAKELNFKPN